MCGGVASLNVYPVTQQRTCLLNKEAGFVHLLIDLLELAQHNPFKTAKLFATRISM